MASVIDVQFEHYHKPNTFGIQDAAPRISWKVDDPAFSFKQTTYEIELNAAGHGQQQAHTLIEKRRSGLSYLVPWPFDQVLSSRQKASVRVRICDEQGNTTPWSEPAHLETGLLNRDDWRCKRIAAPWGPGTTEPDPEQLYRKVFQLSDQVEHARLYITAQGVYEAEINGHRIGDYFLAPGWTSYEGRLQYQTYDVSSALKDGANCIGVRLAEGWFSGRIGFDGGNRNIWGPHTALIVQLEVFYSNGHTETIVSDGSWYVTKGPIKLAEIYNGEKYDARDEIDLWSSAETDTRKSTWVSVVVLPNLSSSTKLTAGYGEPVRHVEVISPKKKITTPSGKTVLDFGQNLVGILRVKNIQGPRGHKMTFRHAEVLENGELGTRPLRICDATDEYILRGDEKGEKYEPRFTFHGFRYAEIEGWLGDLDLESVEAVVCHTDMKPAGSFKCSDPLLNQLYKNIVWGMRGNFFSVPTDCPQRDERLGYSGDLALFAPTATLLYDCFGILKNWLIDVEYDQMVLNGVPPIVSPNACLPDPKWCRRHACAIWHDVTILAPWELYMETGDKSILSQQYNSMMTWMKVLPRDVNGANYLWDPTVPRQLGDWLDPAAPSDAPWKASTDVRMVCNMFLIHSLDLMAKITLILGQYSESSRFKLEAEGARTQFQDEYVTRNGRIVSDSQAAYALAICFDILTPAQKPRAGARLAELVRKNDFKIGTGFAGTPYLCEALALSGYPQVAYSMLLNKKCPSWLYPVTMGATTVWERWDSMLPDGSINPGEMTSFNHYAFGAIGKFMYERLAGLQRVDPGWKKCRVAPTIGADFTQASASHVTPYGEVSCSWKTSKPRGSSEGEGFRVQIKVPINVTVEVVIPEKDGERREVVGAGEWEFESLFERNYTWPVESLDPRA